MLGAPIDYHWTVNPRNEKTTIVSSQINTTQTLGKMQDPRRLELQRNHFNCHNDKNRKKYKYTNILTTF